MPSILQSTVRNRVLRALPAKDFALLAKELKPVRLHLGQTIHQSDEVIEHVYFVETGFISALAVLTDGQPLEIGLIGAEGVAGASVVMGAATSYSETMCQTGGDTYQMSAAAFLKAVSVSAPLRDIVLRVLHLFHVQVAQTAACNAHHDLSERLARWLLAAHDRAGVPELSLTQDLIAVMLGVRRSTVSVAAGFLQKAGIIRYQHGKITVLSRVGLEDAACECYEAVSSEYRRLFDDEPLIAPPISTLS